MSDDGDIIAGLQREMLYFRARLAALEDATGLFVPDKMLVGTKGNPKVRFKPKTFVGPDCKGRLFSECPPEFLDVYADALQFSSENPRPGYENSAQYDALDAKRARSWARRMRSGWTPPESNAPAFPTAGAAAAPSFGAPGFAAPSFGAPSFGAPAPKAADPTETFHADDFHDDFDQTPEEEEITW